MADVCEHGTVRRQCNACEVNRQDIEINQLRSENERLKAENKALRFGFEAIRDNILEERETMCAHALALANQVTNDTAHPTTDTPAPPIQSRQTAPNGTQSAHAENTGESAAAPQPKTYTADEFSKAFARAWGGENKFMDAFRRAVLGALEEET